MLARLHRGQGVRLATTRFCKRLHDRMLTQQGTDVNFALGAFGEPVERNCAAAQKLDAEQPVKK